MSTVETATLDVIMGNAPMPAHPEVWRATYERWHAVLIRAYQHQGPLLTIATLYTMGERRTIEDIRAYEEVAAFFGLLEGRNDNAVLFTRDSVAEAAIARTGRVAQ